MSHQHSHLCAHHAQQQQQQQREPSSTSSSSNSSTSSSSRRNETVTAVPIVVPLGSQPQQQGRSNSGSRSGNAMPVEIDMAGFDLSRLQQMGLFDSLGLNGDGSGGGLRFGPDGVLELPEGAVERAAALLQEQFGQTNINMIGNMGMPGLQFHTLDNGSVALDVDLQSLQSALAGGLRSAASSSSSSSAPVSRAGAAAGGIGSGGGNSSGRGNTSGSNSGSAGNGVSSNASPSNNAPLQAGMDSISSKLAAAMLTTAFGEPTVEAANIAGASISVASSIAASILTTTRHTRWFNSDSHGFDGRLLNAHSPFVVGSEKSDTYFQENCVHCSYGILGHKLSHVSPGEDNVCQFCVASAAASAPPFLLKHLVTTMAAVYSSNEESRVAASKRSSGAAGAVTKTVTAAAATVRESRRPYFHEVFNDASQQVRCLSTNVTALIGGPQVDFSTFPRALRDAHRRNERLRLVAFLKFIGDFACLLFSPASTSLLSFSLPKPVETVQVPSRRARSHAAAVNKGHPSAANCSPMYVCRSCDAAALRPTPRPRVAWSFSRGQAEFRRSFSAAELGAHVIEHHKEEFLQSFRLVESVHSAAKPLHYAVQGAHESHMSFALSALLNTNLFIPINVEHKPDPRPLTRLPKPDFVNVLAPNLIPTVLEMKAESGQAPTRHSALNISHEYLRLRLAGQDGHARRELPTSLPMEHEQRHATDDVDTVNKMLAAVASARECARASLDQRYTHQIGSTRISDVTPVFGGSASNKQQDFFLSPAYVNVLEELCYGAGVALMPKVVEPPSAVSKSHASPDTAASAAASKSSPAVQTVKKSSPAITNARLCGMVGIGSEAGKRVETQVSAEILASVTDELLLKLVTRTRAEVEREVLLEEKKQREAQLADEANRALELERCRKNEERKQRRERRKIEAEYMTDDLVETAVEGMLRELASILIGEARVAKPTPKPLTARHDSSGAPIIARSSSETAPARMPFISPKSSASKANPVPPAVVPQQTGEVRPSQPFVTAAGPSTPPPVILSPVSPSVVRPPVAVVSGSSAGATVLGASVTGPVVGPPIIGRSLTTPMSGHGTVERTAGLSNLGAPRSFVEPAIASHASYVQDDPSDTGDALFSEISRVVSEPITNTSELADSIGAPESYYHPVFGNGNLHLADGLVDSMFGVTPAGPNVAPNGALVDSLWTIGSGMPAAGTSDRGIWGSHNGSASAFENDGSDLLDSLWAEAAQSPADTSPSRAQYASLSDDDPFLQRGTDAASNGLLPSGLWGDISSGGAASAGGVFGYYGPDSADGFSSAPGSEPWASPATPAAMRSLNAAAQEFLPSGRF